VRTHTHTPTTQSYFSSSSGLELHPFICVAILSTLADDFLEIDGDSIVAYLRRLPQLDIDVIISLAFTFQRQLKIDTRR
jgi:hypothetical protein